MIKNRFIIVSFLLVIVGCAFSGKNLPTVGYEELVTGGLKQSVSFDCKAVSCRQEKPGLPMKINFQSRIEKVLKESGMFSTISANSETTTYHLSFKLHGRPDQDSMLSAGEIMYAAICGLTFCTVPPLVHYDNYILSVDVRRGMEVIKQYHYNDSFGGFMWTLVGMISGAIKMKFAEKQFVDNLLKNFLKDLQQDKILETASNQLYNSYHSGYDNNRH